MLGFAENIYSRQETKKASTGTFKSSEKQMIFDDKKT
jgi:hypothetical protein